MRFMMLMYPQSSDAEAGTMPTLEMVEAMMKYNEDLAKAGVLVGADGLHPTSRGARVRFPNGKAAVTDGPFAEAKEVLGGFWMLRVNSREEAIEWASRCPIQDAHAFVELRQVFEMEDFPQDLQAAADNPIVREAVEQGGRAS